MECPKVRPRVSSLFLFCCPSVVAFQWLYEVNCISRYPALIIVRREGVKAKQTNQKNIATNCVTFKKLSQDTHHVISAYISLAKTNLHVPNYWSMAKEKKNMDRTDSINQ